MALMSYLGSLVFRCTTPATDKTFINCTQHKQVARELEVHSTADDACRRNMYKRGDYEWLRGLRQ
jgi:hypothetical protein